MDSPFSRPKSCRTEVRTLILSLVIIVTIISVFESFTFPHGTTLLLLIPAFKVPFIESLNFTFRSVDSPLNLAKLRELPTLRDNVTTNTEPQLSLNTPEVLHKEEDPKQFWTTEVSSDRKYPIKGVPNSEETKRDIHSVKELAFSHLPFSSSISPVNGILPLNLAAECPVIPVSSDFSAISVEVIEVHPNKRNSELLENNSVVCRKNPTVNIAPYNNQTVAKDNSHLGNGQSTPLMHASRRRHGRYRSMKHRWSSTHDPDLLYAKEQILHAPLVTKDRDLYAPVFRNLSIFKSCRSYELMEHIFKVYIYPEGERPIFHKPDLKGIYSSEGWFMKLIEGNEQFTVKDPRKAHMFYLPYSSRILQQVLYVPNSHILRPLALFLKNYVDMIAAKYPFWNRTGGTDHFLVACHDWGAYETKLHLELRKNAMKALCNADLSEGIFKPGRDVSLPETFVISSQNPTKDIGGKPISQRSILAFFAGKLHGRVRPILLKHWENKESDMKIFGPMPSGHRRRRAYIEYMKSSKYCICPMGYEVNSPRIVEAIHYECVPVIIADNFELPFSEALKWDEFSVVVLEREIPRLKEILLSIPERRYASMQENVRRVQKHFLWHNKPVRYDIFHMILHSIWFNRVNTLWA
ncbi:hypothetical protein AMTRI_Chr05g57840 [Amborella trichopoda]